MPGVCSGLLWKIETLLFACSKKNCHVDDFKTFRRVTGALMHSDSCGALCRQIVCAVAACALGFALIVPHPRRRRPANQRVRSAQSARILAMHVRPLGMCFPHGLDLVVPCVLPFNIFLFRERRFGVGARIYVEIKSGILLV